MTNDTQEARAAAQPPLEAVSTRELEKALRAYIAADPECDGNSGLCRRCVAEELLDLCLHPTPPDSESEDDLSGSVPLSEGDQK